MNGEYIHVGTKESVMSFEMEIMKYLPEGHPITQRPSTSACVERLPNLARSSSLISPPLAGPMAIVRWAMWMVALLRDAAAVAARRKVEDSMVRIFDLSVGSGEVVHRPSTAKRSVKSRPHADVTLRICPVVSPLSCVVCPNFTKSNYRCYLHRIIFPANEQ